MWARARAALGKKIESASASGARKNQGALGDERRSSNLRKLLIKMLNTLEFWPSTNARIEQKIYNAMCILTASGIEVKSHQKVMITVSKEAKFKKIKIWITFYFSGRARGWAVFLSLRSARDSGAHFFDNARDRERRSQKCERERERRSEKKLRARARAALGKFRERWETSGALQISENDLSKCSIHLTFNLVSMLELNKKFTMPCVFWLQVQ